MKKAPEGAFLFCAMQGSGSSERLDLGRKAALGARSLVLVNDLLVGDAVKYGNRLLEDALSGGFVAGFDGLAHPLDRGTQGRTLAGVMGALLVSLTGTLAGLSTVGHVENPESRKGENYSKKRILSHQPCRYYL
jgi:hypothetical protein